MADIVRFPGITTLDLDPDVILEEAHGQLESVVIIGTTKEGGEYFASSTASGPEVLWDLQRAQMKLLKIMDGE